MPYSEAEMEEIERDPERLRAYYWHMAKHWQRLARRYRRESRSTGELHPVTNYRAEFDNGLDKIKWAKTLEASAELMLANLDGFVNSTLVSHPDAAGQPPSPSPLTIPQKPG